MGFRGRTVAPGPADLLVIGLDTAGQVGVEDITHIRLVDPHAEGDGGDDDHPRIGHEDILVRFPVLLLHARVIGKRPHAVRRQQGGGFLPSSCATSNRRLPLSPSWRAIKSRSWPFQSRFISTDSLMFGRSKPRTKDSTEPPNNRFAMSSRGHFIGGRRQRGDWNPGEQIPQSAQVFVFPAGKPVPIGKCNAPRRWRTASPAIVPVRPASPRSSDVRGPCRVAASRLPPARRQAAILSARPFAELMLSAATPASLSAATWSCISATSGDTTTVSPSVIKAGI